MVNDGSTDSTLSLLEQYAAKEPDTSLRIISIPNGGVSAARNLGISHARGEFLWFVDADDYILPGTLQLVLHTLSTCKYDAIRVPFVEEKADATESNTLKDVPPNPSIDEAAHHPCSSNLWCTSLPSSCQNKDWPRGVKRIQASNLVLYAASKRGGPWAWIWRRSAVGNIIFDSKAKIHEDGCFIYEVMQTIESAGEFTMPIYAYILYPDSVSHRQYGIPESFDIGLATADKLQKLYINSIAKGPTHPQSAALSEFYRAQRDYYLFMYCIWPLVKYRCPARQRKDTERRLRAKGFWPIGPLGSAPAYNVRFSRQLSALWLASRSKLLWPVLLRLLQLRFLLKR